MEMCAPVGAANSCRVTNRSRLDRRSLAVIPASGPGDLAREARLWFARNVRLSDRYHRGASLAGEGTSSQANPLADQPPFASSSSRSIDIIGSAVMTIEQHMSAQDCLTRAAACERLADMARSQVNRQALRYLARRWRALADEDEAKLKPLDNSQVPPRAPLPSSDGESTREDSE
jgi:hypothetical protein